jgi:hypothetical protein
MRNKQPNLAKKVLERSRTENPALRFEAWWLLFYLFDQEPLAHRA